VVCRAEDKGNLKLTNKRVMSIVNNKEVVNGRIEVLNISSSVVGRILRVITECPPHGAHNHNNSKTSISKYAKHNKLQYISLGLMNGDICFN
jgi:hypothetical protein